MSVCKRASCWSVTLFKTLAAALCRVEAKCTRCLPCLYMMWYNVILCRTAQKVCLDLTWSHFPQVINISLEVYFAFSWTVRKLSCCNWVFCCATIYDRTSISRSVNYTRKQLSQRFSQASSQSMCLLRAHDSLPHLNIGTTHSCTQSQFQIQTNGMPPENTLARSQYSFILAFYYRATLCVMAQSKMLRAP